MKILLINDVAGRLDQVQAVLQVTAGERVDAVVVLGNLVATAAREHVAELEAAVGDFPRSPAPGVADEIAVEARTYAGVFACLGAAGLPIYVIPGAHDDLAALDAACGHYEGRASIVRVHGTAAKLTADCVVAGLGGAIAPAEGAWTGLEYPAQEVKAAFEHVARTHAKIWGLPQRILLFATTPFAGAMMPQAQLSDGATAVAAVIRDYRPAWVFYGGTGSRQQNTQHDGTHMVNPGAVQHGEYAVIDLERGHVQISRVRAMQEDVQPAVLTMLNGALAIRHALVG
jgi:Icc-related predicted phosphoesterase